jgi:hypothetical protein
MPGLLVHFGAITNCSHLAPVNVIPSSPPRVFVNRSQTVFTIADLHTVAGCPFQIPVGVGTKPQPCVLVKLEAAQKVFISGVPVAILTPIAIGQSAEQIPQGPPNSSAIQKRVIAT